jgi:hypothetical protein
VGYQQNLKIVAVMVAALMNPLLFAIQGFSLNKPEQRPAKVFVFERLNKSYVDVSPEIVPIREGPLTIRLSSPHHVLTLRHHTLKMIPLSDGMHNARLQVEFLGSGDLIADLDLVGLNSKLEDNVTIPLQTKTINGRARLSRSQGGYSIIPVVLPATVELEIQSGIAKRLVGWCDQVSWLPSSILDCNKLDRSLSKVSVPVPQDRSYFLSDSDLTEEERAEIDRYLKSSSGRT